MVFMNIYSSDADDFFFFPPYVSKELIVNSISRTLEGYNLIYEHSIFTGCCKILLGRIESAAAIALVAFSSALLGFTSVCLTPIFIIPATILNIASRIPGISSFKSVQDFTNESSDAIYRIFRIYLIAVPTISLFLSLSIINLLLPGLLKSENIFFNLIHRLVEPLGPLEKIRVTVPNVKSIIGTEANISILVGVEDYFRAFSYKNYLREIKLQSFTHHYSYSS